MNIGSILNQATTVKQLSPQLERLKKASQDVEAIFLKDMISAMRRSIPKEEIGDSYGSKIYEDMFDTAMAQGMSQTNSLGLAKTLYKNLSKAVLAQEKARLDIEAEKPTTDNKG